MKYDLIMLIITSSDVPIYEEFKNIISMYHSKYTDRVRHFYVEFKPDIQEDVLENGEYIYIKGNETFKPGIYEKTMAAIRHVNSKYDYKHIIRTNVSSFWNLENTLEYQKQLPIKDFAGGILNGHSLIDIGTIAFITGTGIFITKDIAEKISNIKLQNDIECYDTVSNSTRFCSISQIFNDDVSFSIILQMIGYEIHHIGHDKWKLCINDSDSIDDFEYNEFYYRVKNNDRNIDVILFNKLYEKIYR